MGFSSDLVSSLFFLGFDNPPLNKKPDAQKPEMLNFGHAERFWLWDSGRWRFNRRSAELRTLSGNDEEYQPQTPQQAQRTRPKIYQGCHCSFTLTLSQGSKGRIFISNSQKKVIIVFSNSLSAIYLSSCISDRLTCFCASPEQNAIRQLEFELGKEILDSEGQDIFFLFEH